MSNQIHYNVCSNQTITATGQGDMWIPNPDPGSPLIAVIDINVAGVVTGTTPNMVVYGYSSPDGVNTFQSGSSGNITAPTTKRIVLQQFIEPWLQVHFYLTGTTPSFGGVTVDVFIAVDS